MSKKFKLTANQIKPLVYGMGGCIATDKITVNGEKVGYMERTAPHNPQDSGWQFLSGTEDQAYLDNVKNSAIYDVNTIANYDSAVIPYLQLPYGTTLARIAGTDKFEILPE